MVDVTIALPVFSLHEGVVRGAFLEEAYMLGRLSDGLTASVECRQAFARIASALRCGHGEVTVTVSRETLGPLARIARYHAADTYQGNPAVPILLDLATAAVMAAAKAA